MAVVAVVVTAPALLRAVAAVALAAIPQHQISPASVVPPSQFRSAPLALPATARPIPAAVRGLPLGSTEQTKPRRRFQLMAAAAAFAVPAPQPAGLAHRLRARQVRALRGLAPLAVLVMPPGRQAVVVARQAPEV